MKSKSSSDVKYVTDGVVKIVKILVIVFIISSIIGLIAFLIYFFAIKKTISKENYNTMENFTNPDELTPKEGEVVVALFSADWCPHCRDYKPVWEKLMPHSGKKVGSKTIKFVSVDCTESCPVSSKYDIEGYPSVVAISPNGHKHLTSRNSLEEITKSLEDM